MAKTKALLLDRDGIINIDHGYLFKTQQIDFVPGVFNLLRCAEALGFILIMVTNQSGIGRGYFSINDYFRVQRYINHCCFLQGINIRKVYFCPHAPDNDPPCDCRKPRAGMVNQAADEFSLDLTASWLVGDKLSDMQAGLTAGVNNLALLSSSSLAVGDELARLVREPQQGVTQKQSNPISARLHRLANHSDLQQLLLAEHHELT